MQLPMSAFEAVWWTWLWPGLGHQRAGMPGRARFFGWLLASLFVVGLVLSRGGAVTPSEHPFYFGLGQLWCGGFLVLGGLSTWFVDGGGARFGTYEIGQLYVTTAILLNILACVDLLRRLGEREKAHASRGTARVTS